MKTRVIRLSGLGMLLWNQSVTLLLGMLLLNQGMTRRLEARDVSITKTWNRMLQIAARAGLSRSVALQRLDNLKLQKHLSMRHPGTRKGKSSERTRLCRPVPLQRQLLHQQRQHILRKLSPCIQQQ